MLLDPLKKFSLTDRQAAFDGKEYMSFRQLWRRSEAIAARLIREYPARKPAAIFGDKENDMLSCMFAAIKSGRPYVCIPSYYPVERINTILADCGAEIVLNPAEKRIHDVGLPVIGADELRRAEQAMESDDIVSQKDYLQPGDIVCIIYTSGSTGTPKGVQLTYENIESKIKLTEEFMGPSMPAENGRAVNLAAYSFSAALSYVYYVMMYAGCTIYCVPRAKMADHLELLDYLENINPDVFSCTPTMIDRLLSSDRFCPKHFPHMCYSCLGGEPLLMDTVSRFRERFPKIRLLNALGVTEAAGTPLTCEITPKLMASSVSYFPVGVSSSEYAYLIDESGARITEDDQAGELVICSKTVARGYLNRPEQTAQAFFTDDRNDWAYRTRDLLQYHRGYYYFIGRKDNQVKIGGNRFELEDAEANLRKTAPVKECACAVQKLDTGAKLLVGFVVRKDPAMPKMKAILSIKQELKQRVESYMIPSKLIFVDALPKNVNLKIDRAALERMAQNA